jgi:hypothetical protein
MLGGVRWPEAVHLPDAAVSARLAEDLSRTLGLADPPQPLGFVRWPRAVPQPARDPPRAHALARRAAGRSARARTRGSYVAGVSCRTRSRRGRRGGARARRGAVRLNEHLRDRLDPGGVRIRTIDQQELLAAERSPLLARADADLLDRLEAVGRERRAQDREPAHARAASSGSTWSVNGRIHGVRPSRDWNEVEVCAASSPSAATSAAVVA